jgi:hypothetical protein
MLMNARIRSRVSWSSARGGAACWRSAGSSREQICGAVQGPCVRGLLAPLFHKTDWQLSEYGGELTPWGLATPGGPGSVGRERDRGTSCAASSPRRRTAGWTARARGAGGRRERVREEGPVFGRGGRAAHGPGHRPSSRRAHSEEGRSAWPVSRRSTVCASVAGCTYRWRTDFDLSSHSRPRARTSPTSTRRRASAGSRTSSRVRVGQVSSDRPDS